MTESDREPAAFKGEAQAPTGASETASGTPLSVSSAVTPDAPLEGVAEPKLSRRERELAQRLEALSAAIAAAPDDPINYVLRGELRLALGDLENAAEDFRRGLLLIIAIGETDWGYVHTALAERAQEGLRRCL
ncbi:MAG: hypothetical protein RML95_01155 [Anaerolineae bacterium]|nr:hypothetical protein [Anaerolineae bacterium]MDW8297921.1 hypothetical protein [Anaerolineae bacterium]